MTVKSKKHVSEYASRVAEIQAALQNILEWTENLPAPDDAYEIPNLHYGHMGTIERIHNLVGEISKATDGFHD
jgi:hypothetical protein